MLLWIVALVAAVLLWVALKLVRAGYFDKLEPEVVEKPQILSHNLEIFYKHHVGPYSENGKFLCELRSLLPKEARLIALYYDDPTVVEDEFCQSAIGCISSDGQSELEPHFATQLVRWGYERMQVPAVERAVHATHPYAGGFFAHLRLVRRSYPTLRAFLKEARMETELNVEVFANGSIHILCPLDHQQEFLVPEYTPTDELIERQLEAREAALLDDSDSDLEEEEESELEEEELASRDQAAQLA